MRLRFRLLTVAEPQESAGDGVRFAGVCKKLLGLQRAVVEDVWIEEEQLVVAVRPAARERDRCPRCRRLMADLDLLTVLEAAAPLKTSTQTIRN